MGGWRQQEQRWRPYVSVAQRKLNAAAEAARLAKKGHRVDPVRIEGRTIATTFWGKAWCTHLEAFSDYESRLPRGRTYARNGSVVDLQIAAGKITALVQGSDMYTVNVTIAPLAQERWKTIAGACAGKIDSLVELLQGRLSAGVMGVITERNKGLFPLPEQIKLSCSCPDWATMCKHVAAVMYGIGARLDTRPDLLFVLRGVDHMALIRDAGAGAVASRSGDAKSGLEGSDLGEIFGIEIDARESAKPAVKPRRPARRAKKQTLTSTELRERGLAASTIQSWLKRGWLERTSTREEYLVAPDAAKQLAKKVARR